MNSAPGVLTSCRTDAVHDSMPCHLRRTRPQSSSMSTNSIGMGLKLLIRSFVLVFSLIVSACSDEASDIGNYRVVTATDGLFGLRCQPRNDFYFVDSSIASAEPVYLGTCSTPRFVTKHMGMPSDPSCFAVSADGTSLVYLHRPDWCGAGSRAAMKLGGVYFHSPEGDTLLYSKAQVGQIWSRAAIEPNAIRVSWHSAEPSRGGAVCSQKLIIRADGSEQPEGEPNTVHGCASGRVNEQ